MRLLYIISGVILLACFSCNNNQSSYIGTPADTSRLVTNVDKDSISDEITSDVLRFQKDSLSLTMELILPKVLLDYGVKGKNLNFCFSYRAAQIFSKCWKDNTFKSGDVEYIKVGTPLKGVADLFTKYLGVDPVKIIIPATNNSKELKLADAWFELKIKNGKTIILKATKNLIPDRMLELKEGAAKGDKNARKEFRKERTKLETILKTIPFKDKLLVEIK